MNFGSCVDMHWDDPRTKAEKADDMAYELAHPVKDDNGKTVEAKGMITHGKGSDGDAIEIDWSINPVIVSEEEVRWF